MSIVLFAACGTLLLHTSSLTSHGRCGNRACNLLRAYTRGLHFLSAVYSLFPRLVCCAGVVPEHEVQKILHRRVLEQFLMRQKHLILQFSYKSLRNNVSFN
jgi:hypothetical protein